MFYHFLYVYRPCVCNKDILLLSKCNENVTSQGFFPKISRPTRSFENSHSLIDNIFSNNLCKPHTSGILTHHISDHFMNFCIVESKTKKKPIPNKYIEVENVNPKSIANFKNFVAKSELISQLDNNPYADPNHNYNILSSVIEKAKDVHIPKKVKKFNVRKHFRNPWMTNELLTLINRKNDLYREWKSTSNDIEYEHKKVNFKTFEKIVHDEIKLAQNRYYLNSFTAKKNDMKKTWATINETLNRNRKSNDFPLEFIVNNESITDTKDIANHFNNFFSNIGTNLSSSIKLEDRNAAFTDYLHNPTDHRFTFSQINEREVLSIINKLKNKTSSGKDGISNKLLKSIKSEISEAIAIIINQSILTGIFPDQLKLAKVKPLYKKGDKCCLNNYRPISLLPTLSKIFERVMYKQLYQYFNENKLLCEQQYGFRSQHSTELAAVKLVDYIIKEMDCNKKVKTPVALFLDLSKAFDTLTFDILLAKLKHYGVHGKSLALIKNYLTNRSQYVQFENQESCIMEIKTGIPQGSILGPLFFSILINDLINSSKMLSFLMYADDTTIYFNLEDFPVHNRHIEINRELDKVNTWLKVNKLSLNVEKTKCMLFHKRRQLNPIQFSINGRDIDVVSHFNYLGIILDENISWKKHVAMITNKLSKISGVLHRLKYIYPQNILETIYKSLFVPHLNYGLLLWGRNLDSITKFQKRAIRTITNSNFIAHSEPLLKELKLLNVQCPMSSSTPCTTSNSCLC